MRVPIFEVAITFSDNPTDVFYCEHDTNMAKGAWGQTCWYEGRGVSIYVAKDAPADTLVHECVHAAGIILKMRGIEYSPTPQDEVLAYLTGYIYKRIKKTTEVRK